MQFQNWQDFLTMGGYGFYVWLAFAVTLCAIVLLILDSTLTQPRLLKQAKEEAARKARIRQAQAAQKATSEKTTPENIQQQIPIEPDNKMSVQPDAAGT